MDARINDPTHRRSVLTMFHHLFDNDGDKFALALADYIRQSRLHISDDALKHVADALKVIRC